jgi:hypothetical protein
MAPASRLPALALAVVVLLLAGAPSVAARKGSPPDQRKEASGEKRRANPRRGILPDWAKADLPDAAGGRRSSGDGDSGTGSGGKGAGGSRRSGRTGEDGPVAGSVPRRSSPTATRPSSSPRSGVVARERTRVPASRRAADPSAWSPPRRDSGSDKGTFGTAAVETSRALAFPLALSLLALAFLIAQGRVDDRDPKLARAPLTGMEQLVAFE